VPDTVFSSPYIRAYDTARIAVETAAADVSISTDERLRERDLGLFDGLTAQGIREHYPEEMARRAWLGKFYYRPPYGESWADVALRVRAFLADARSWEGERITIFSHQAVLFVFRYVIEQLTEHQVLSIDRESGFHNGGVTGYAADSDGRLQLVAHDAIDHLHDQQAPATIGHDSHVEV
jgi:2,3-bisphosphoglycerate-dependent phosphoglycerate mutase